LEKYVAVMVRNSISSETLLCSSYHRLVNASALGQLIEEAQIETATARKSYAQKLPTIKHARE
jgi:hypothetical protein